MYLLGSPINMEQVEREVARRFDHHVARALEDGMYRVDLYPKLFSERSSLMIMEALRHVSNEASTILDRLLAAAPVLPVLDEFRLREEHDAVRTATEFANLSRSAIPRQPPADQLAPGVPFGLSFERQLIDNEDDQIAADLRRFDSASELQELAGSMVRVYDDRLCLTVINVNRKPLERVHGVDLVYYDHIADTAVGVQYKRLKQVDVASPDGSSTDWVYRDKSQIVKQLRLMENETLSAATTADDWRLSTSPNFFKFVRPQDFDPNSRDLLRGMYIPDEYLRLGIREGKFQTGPRSGFQIGYRNARYFPSRVFIELVRRCWIGTQETNRSALAERVAELAIEDEVVLAIKSAWPR